ncbi:MAG: PAS domain S-box protein [Treponema sp.]|jgi:PAS domain S-box-containing protein|nr:PAS domain S-box protein [Treponema sp.]
MTIAKSGKKAITARFPYQVMLVLLAFGLMVLFSYIYVSGIEREHLRKDAYNTLTIAQSQIEGELKEFKTAANSIVQSVCRLILENKSQEEVIAHMKEAAGRIFTQGDFISGYGGIYGYFDCFNGLFIHSVVDMNTVPDFDAKTRPWYTAAAEAGGKTVMTQPYVSIATGDITITYATQLLDDAGVQLAIIGLDVTFERIKEFSKNAQLTKNGYGVLVINYEVASHPVYEPMSKHVGELAKGAEVTKDMEDKKEFFEYQISSYTGQPSILSYKRIENGWYLGLITPNDQYYASMRTMMGILISLGSAMAALLCVFLMRLNAARHKADAEIMESRENMMHEIREANKRTLLMLDTSPLCTQIWGRDLNTIDCNEAGVKLYGFKDKQEYLNKFLECCSPEYQPDGQRSDEKASAFVNKAFEEGHCIFEWMHKMPYDDTPIPAEITLVRAKYSNDDVVIGYTRDLREQKAAINEIDKLDRTRTLSEYELMKYRLTSDALNIALWDMDVISADPVNPVNHITYSQEFRRMNGFDDENDYPNLLSSWSDRLHPEDKDKSVNAFAAHMNDYTGKTPFDVEYRLMLKNGQYRWFRALGDTLRNDAGVPLRVAGALMDIDDEKQTQNQLRIMSSIVQNSPNFISYKKISGECLYLNPAASALTGYTHEELVKDYLGILFISEPAKAVVAKIAADLSASGLCQFEIEGVKKDGEVKTFAGISFLVDRTSYATIAYDVTDKQKAQDDIEYRDKLLYAANIATALLLDVNAESFEDTLIQSMQVIGEAINVHHVGVWKNYMKDGRMYYSLLQEWSSELRPPVSGSYVKEIPYDEFLHGLYEQLSQGNDYINHIGNMPPKDREQLNPQKILSLFATPVFVKDNFWGFVGFEDCLYDRAFSDIEATILRSTGRLIGNAFYSHEMELEMKGKSELIRIMFENAPVGLTLFDDNFKYVDCNETVLKIYGVTREFYAAFFGSTDHSPEYQPDGRESGEKALAVIKRVMDGETLTIDWTHCTPGGEYLPVELTMTRVMYGDRYIGLGYIYDMREQTRLKKQIEAALIEAKDANRAKSEFLSHISHEIRTPMNTILGSAEIQLQKDNNPQDTEEAFNRIYNSGNLLLNIINDILDISKIEAGKLELIHAKYDIPSLIYDTMQINLLRYESKPIDFILKVDENTPLNMFGDELRIKQILNNILSNAFKYTEKGSVELSVSAETDTMVDNECVLVLRVSDTGQGMDQDQINKLFDAYARFNLEANRHVAGTGLGMSITKQFIDMMNGEITVESSPGKGTVFTVRLPQKKTGFEICGTGLVESLRKNSFQNLARAKKLKIIHEYMPYGSVLIVDDVESNLYVAKGMMLPYGLKIETVISGIDAIEKIKSGNEYDVIFMDHMMPKMDGMEAAKIIRELGFANSIVALTANAIAGQSEMFLNNGFDSFISKPIDSRELDAVLNHLVRDKYPPEVVRAARREKGQQKTDILSESAQKAAANNRLAEVAAKDIGNAIVVLEEIITKIKTNSSGAAGNGAASSVDIDLYNITVHGMKSALANIGESELSHAASVLEQAAGNGDMEVISNKTPDFIEALRSLNDRIKSPDETSAGAGDGATGGSGDSAGVSDDDMVFLREKLNEIKTACEKVNVKSAKAALAAIKQKTWPQEISKMLKEIQINLIDGDLRKVVSIAEEALGM